MKVVEGGIYQHYRTKNQYKVIGLAHHSETLEEMVVYQGLYDSEEFGSKSIWVRPLHLFVDAVVVDGQSLPRFKYINN